MRRGLVREENRRIERKRSRDRHALLLPAREIAGTMVAALVEPKSASREFARLRARAVLHPAASSGSWTFSLARRPGIRLKAWKTTPIVRCR
jgi:hypothetical protein